MSAEILEKFGQHLKEIRLKKGLSQEQLGLSSDLDRTYISGIERGKRNVSLLNIVKLADSLGISLKDIIDFGTSGE